MVDETRPSPFRPGGERSARAGMLHGRMVGLRHWRLRLRRVLLLSLAILVLLVHAGCGSEEVASTVSADRAQAKKARERQIARLEGRVARLERERRRKARVADSPSRASEARSALPETSAARLD